MSIHKKGFTLIEMIVVIIIIAILASIAVANYFKAVERSRSEEARVALRMILAAENFYRAKSVGGTYWSSPAQPPDSLPVINAFLHLNLIENGIWDYQAPGGAGITATATRQNCTQECRQLRIDQNGAITCQGVGCTNYF